jgi:hypothetical protein
MSFLIMPLANRAGLGQTVQRRQAGSCGAFLSFRIVAASVVFDLGAGPTLTDQAYPDPKLLLGIRTSLLCGRTA